MAYEQMSIFDMILQANNSQPEKKEEKKEVAAEPQAKEVPTPIITQIAVCPSTTSTKAPAGKKEVAKNVATKKKKVIYGTKRKDEFFSRLSLKITTFGDLLREYGYDGLKYGNSWICSISGDSYTQVWTFENKAKAIRLHNPLELPNRSIYEKNYHVLYVDEDLSVWDNCYEVEFSGDKTFLTEKWKKPQNVTGRLISKICLWKQSREEILGIIRKVNPYRADYLDAIKSNETFYQNVTAPQLELLSKAGYVFANNIRDYDYDMFNRLTKFAPGGKLKDYFNVPPMICKILKNETSLSIWDSFRKMDKLGLANPEDYEIIHKLKWSADDIQRAYEIIRQKDVNGKKIFTWNSLIRYLNRIEMYEAISRYEAFPLIKDYLMLCQTLKIVPRTDSDSLKREHDVMAKNARMCLNPELEEKLKKVCHENMKYNYSENEYLIRTISSADDLLDEARQQSNCLAAYQQYIIDKCGIIMVMREVANPDKSLITVELSPDGKKIVQKLGACNAKIYNKEQTEFLERWIKWCKTR